MDKIILPPGIDDLLLEAIHFEEPEDVRNRIVALLTGPPKAAKKAKRALPFLLAAIVRSRKLDLLKTLSEPLLEHGVPVDGRAVQAAAALPLEWATRFLDALFALGWDINSPLSNPEPPVLRLALDNIWLTQWLLDKGADPNVPSYDLDYTPLSIAVECSPLPIVQLLLHYGRHRHNGHLAYHATQRANVEEALYIIRLLHAYNKPLDDVLYQDVKSSRLRGQFTLGTPLYYACLGNKEPVANLLRTLGCDPDKQCVSFAQNVDPTPRQIALLNGWSDWQMVESPGPERGQDED